jgi:hypothetical protein
MQAFFHPIRLKVHGSVLFLLLLLIASTMSAQGDHRNLEKYWRYRQRLRELFVKVGPGPGESIPAAEISRYREVFGNPGVTYGQSDGTATLGWYIAVLASEHGLLVRNGLPTAENEEELYFALNALWRLDAQSNFYSYLTGDWPACTTLAAGAPMGPMSAMDYDDDNILDGYAIRSDAQYGFHTNFPGMDNTSSEVISPFGRNCRSKEMSHDQSIYLMMGLMAVKKWVDPAVEFNGVPLRRFAINEGGRIVNMLWNPPKKDWTLRNPLTDSVVPIGANGVGWAYPKAKMGEALLDSPGAFDAGNPGTVWNAQGVPISFGNEMNMAMASMMAAIGNSWGDQTADRLNRMAMPSTISKQGRDREIYYAYHHLIYGSPLEDTYVSSKIYRDMLDLAPCDGPHSTWPDPSPFYGWNTDNRFTGLIWARADIDGDGDKEAYNQFVAGMQGTCYDGDQADLYTGLDYMLLFNLYYLMYDGTEFDPEGNWENLLHAQFDSLCLDQISTLQVRAYPNPSDGNFQIRLRIPASSTVTVDLSTTDGKSYGTVYQSTIPQSGEFLENITLPDLVPGMYILRVIAAGEAAFCRVVILR